MDKSKLTALVAVGVFGAANIAGWYFTPHFNRELINFIEETKGKKAALEYCRDCLEGSGGFLRSFLW